MPIAIKYKQMDETTEEISGKTNDVYSFNVENPNIEPNEQAKEEESKEIDCSSLNEFTSKMNDGVEVTYERVMESDEEAEKRITRENEFKAIKNKPVILTPEEKELLMKELTEKEFESYNGKEINWIDGDYYNSFDKVKGHCKSYWEHKTQVKRDEKGNPDEWKKCFVAHSKDSIKGKPQLIDNVQKTIPLIRRVINKNKEGMEIQSYYFFEEKYDKRYDGYQIDVLSLDFWTYKVISEGKEYYIWTKQKLPNEVCEFKGMLVELDDFAELSRNLKVKSISKVFFLKEFIPMVKILSKEDIVLYTKTREITEQDWFDFLAYHRLGTYNYFTKVFQNLKSAWLLSGKHCEIPLHLAVIGGAGLRKSMGLIENTAFKFDEDFKILEGGNSRLKSLDVSFKENPPKIGYIAECNRVGFIDEIGKMVEFELDKHQVTTGNVLGNVNFLLDNKKRFVGSGNDSGCEVQATAKMMFVLNPISNKPTIYSHIGVIDPTMMSRVVWIVMDKEEQDFVLSEKGITKIPPIPTQALAHSKLNLNDDKKIKKGLVLGMCWGKIESREEFLTLFDSCYSFVCDIDPIMVQQLVNMSCMLAKEPIKSSVWKPRAEHHITLIVDGLCKQRCLFKDYDSSFVAKAEDYELAREILERMIKSWDTNLLPKQEEFK